MFIDIKYTIPNRDCEEEIMRYVTGGFLLYIRALHCNPNSQCILLPTYKNV